jgi:predicted dehydrogenase
LILNADEANTMAKMHGPFNRRRFLQGTAIGLAGTACRPAVWGDTGKNSPNDRVVAAVIGCGGRGKGLLPIQADPRCSIAAVCDVDETHVESARERIGKCDGYGDFRRILDRQDIDAVLIATPDHWHAAMTIAACQAGMDVYCEKPLCRTIREGQQMVAAARRYERVVQMGTQYRSMARVRQVCEWIRNGRLGEVRTVRLSHPPNRIHPNEPPRQPPSNLDWDMWLGPAPWAAYHPIRCHFTYRWFMDYGGGSLADNGVHMFGVVSWAMGTDQTGPVTIEATGTTAPNNMYDAPVEMRVRYEFADPSFEMIWEQPGTGSLNIDFVGTQATLGGFWEFKISEGEADLSPTTPDEIHLLRSDSHSGNWLDCIASRKQPAMDVEIGHRVTSWSHLGNIAYRTGRTLKWDPTIEQFIDDEQANRMLDVTYREPWRLI